MISIYQLKPKFKSLLRPLCTKLSERGVSANQITILACLLSIIYGALLCLNIPLLWLLLPLILFVRMGLNAIDGMLAREHNMSSKLGMALNEICDVIADTALFLPFLFYAPIAAATILLFIFLATMSEFCGLLAYMMSGTRRYDGPMGKSDRAFVTGTLGFLIGLGWIQPNLLVWIFAILSALTLWACFNRIKGSLREGKT